MSLPSPNLDDRTFEQLVEEARQVVQRTCPQWTDLSPGDPGTVLLELFAYLNDLMLYRLNRVPDKAYVEFLRMIGVKLHPPSTATTVLRFSIQRPRKRTVEIPKGTRVTTGRNSGGREAPIFRTLRNVALEPGQSAVEVTAAHCILVEGEAAGVGTGRPGLTLTASQSPMTAPAGDDVDLVVAVESSADELGNRAPALKYRGKTYRIWRECEGFSLLGDNRHVYVADRYSGRISFAPSVWGVGENGDADGSEKLAEAPAQGREIRLWYRAGGGSEGNLPAGALTVLKDPIPGVTVVNPQAASGGRATETLENAKLRGPQEFFALRRAVTAADFERTALEAGAVGRAKAFTKKSIWSFAVPGTVEVQLAPYLAPEEAVGVSAERLEGLQTEEMRRRIDGVLQDRRPLATSCEVNWVRCKTVAVRARAVVHHGEDAKAVEQRVRARLDQVINPLETPQSSGWAFGKPLRASDVYDIILGEPGVDYVDRISFAVDEVPDEKIGTLEADFFQSSCWYAGGGTHLYRSVNDGEGWETVGRFEGERVQVVRSHPDLPGRLAVVTDLAGEAGARLHVSSDCGETWNSPAQTSFEVHDLAWTSRDAIPVLLLASDVGLYEISLDSDSQAVPVQVLVDKDEPDLGFYAVAVAGDVRGGVSVAVAARQNKGVYVSAKRGQSGSFRHIGLAEEAIETLRVQYEGSRVFLWAGFQAAGNEVGKGCARLELRGASDSPEGWKTFAKGWRGGSCRCLAFQGSEVMAATYRAGVLKLDPTSGGEILWQVPKVSCGLPLRDVGRLHPVESVAVDRQDRLLMASGPQGVHLSRDGGVSYFPASRRELEHRVTLPPTWLFCSGQHQIEVADSDET